MKVSTQNNKVKRFYIETLGCQMNVADSELIIAMLNNEGFIKSDSPQNSDLIFINTCSIRERAEEKVHSQLGRWDKIKKNKPEVVIGVLGCMAQNLKQDIIKPTTVYGNNKLVIEQYGSKLHEKSLSKNIGLDFRSIRFPGVISYDTVPSGGTTDYATQMINNAKNGVKFECNLSPNTMLPFIGIDKTISSIIEIMDLEVIESKFRVFNVQQTSFSVKELSDFLLQKFPSFQITYNEDKNFQSVADTWPSSLNCEKAKKFWNFSTEKNFEVFIKKIINKKI